MGTYRKGEQPVPKVVVGWSDDHPVAGGMRRGDKWFVAWMRQMCTPHPRLARRSRISEARLREIEEGSTITRAEVAALAKAWWITPEGLIASMPDPERVTG